MDFPMEKVPEPLKLPDVRRLGTTRSWPEWLASRVASIRIVEQLSTRTGRRGEIPTLPAGAMPTPAMIAEVLRWLSDMRALFGQSPSAGGQWPKEMVKTIAKLLYLRASRTSEIGIEVIAET